MIELPTVDSFIRLLHNCRQKKELPLLMLLHAHMLEYRLEDHIILGNHLVSALVDCGSLPDAQHVFDKLPWRSQHSWKSLISGYTDVGQPHYAFLLYLQMQEQSVQPNSHVLVSLLKACTALLDLEQGHRIHTDIAKRGLEASPFAGSAIVDMYGRCGSLAEAWQVVDQLPIRDTISWTALIVGYTEHGSGDSAISCFEHMQLEGIAPDAKTFACGLKACAMVQALQTGERQHAEITKRGLERELYIGTTLVDMYAKCGALVEAQQLFAQLEIRNVVTWTALLSGLAENGLGDEALKCLDQMQLEAISPDADALICSLKACITMEALEAGKVIYAEITKKALDSNIYVCHSLVDMYATSGWLSEAQYMFDKCPFQSAVLWNALIAGYVEHGLGEMALNCFKKMQLKGTCPVVLTYTSILRACCSIGALEEGQKLHTDMTRRVLERELYAGTTLVDMYAKFGLLADAQRLFDQLPIRNEVAWTALIAGYTEFSSGHKAVNCFQQAQLEGVLSDASMLVCCLKACGIIGALEMGRELHMEIINRGLERELHVDHALVDLYGKCDCLVDARGVFDNLPLQGATAWNALIAGYTEHGFGEEALNCFKQMHQVGLSPIIATFSCTLKACGLLGVLDVGQEIHAEILKRGFEKNPFIGHMLVEMYGNCGSLYEGQEVFDKLLARDTASWTAMLKTYGENHDGIMAIRCFEEMQKQGVKPDAVTFTCLLSACSHGSLVFKGHEIFRLMKDHDIKPTQDHYACMVDLLARSGYLQEAEKFAEAMQYLPSKETLRALLTACKIYGEVEQGFRYFQQLILVDQEDGAPYLLMGELYTTAGRWDEANKIEEMRKQAGANKKAASASIEVNENVQDFVVGGSRRNDVVSMLESLHFWMKGAGYVPVLDVILNHSSDSDYEAPESL